MNGHEGTVPGDLDARLEDDPGPEPGAVTIVVPTFNESANIRELLRRVTDSVPAALPCEVVFVDDSTDDTPEVITEAAQDCPFPVTLIHRERPTGGLGGAVVEGIKAATSPWVVVMDGDLQHPPALVPELVAAGERSRATLVVASRYIEGGSRAGLAGGYRIAVSRLSTWLTKGLFPRGLRGISDPMSGFFAIRRTAVTADALQPLGYKILLELAVRCRPPGVTEVPFEFQDRYAGESKSTAREGLRFLRHLLALRTSSRLARMIVFGLIGLTGFLPNLLALHGLTTAGMHYLPAEIVANQAGVAWNFLLIELLLFRDRRGHRHWADRTARFALIANADLVLRIPLIALLVGQWHMAVLPATALALVTTFVLRFAGTEALIYLPARDRTGRGGRTGSGLTGRGRTGLDRRDGHATTTGTEDASRTGTEDASRTGTEDTSRTAPTEHPTTPHPHGTSRPAQHGRQ
ncbi:MULTISPECIES: glycosyltransferase [unclassified Streptomyces]|uniref:glycosyltransferase n=1 Tax=unclassified Streptomyces TaxID=2593676 RepID=UPI0008238D01|nr:MULTISPECIES: glycosyltransferase family 2 protein [unclassified Streptomyces]SCK15723.1 dolichol-phosphate mannosyltransferase [Streptomyces sp. AmelKG-E11A]